MKLTEVKSKEHTMALPRINQLPTVTNLPKVQQLPRIQRLPQMPSLPELGSPVYKRAETTNLMFDYNDPDQVNSFADVAFRHFDRMIQHGKQGEYVQMLADVIPTELLRDTYTLAKGTIAPGVVNRNWKGVGINLLHNAMETLDLVANPIKGGLLHDEKFFSAEGFMEAAFGRVNYDFDTGSWVTDVGAEILVDPLNWISFGGKAAAKTLAKRAGTKLTSEFGSELAEKQLKKVAKAFALGVSSSSDELSSAVARKQLLSNISQPMQEQIQRTLVHNMNINLITTINTIRKGAEKIDGALLQSALLFSPRLIKTVSTPVLRYVNNAINKTFNPYKLADNIPTTLHQVEQALPDLTKELDSLRAIDNADLSGIVPADIVQRIALDDKKVIRELIDANFKNTAGLRQALNAFAQNANTTWDEYAMTVRRFADSDIVPGAVNNLASYVDDLDKLFHSTDVIQQQYKSNANEFITEFVGEFAKLDVITPTLTDFTRVTEDSLESTLTTLRKMYDRFPDMKSPLDEAKLKQKLDSLLRFETKAKYSLEARTRATLQLVQDTVERLQTYSVWLDDIAHFNYGFTELYSQEFKSANAVIEDLTRKGVIKADVASVTTVDIPKQQFVDDFMTDLVSFNTTLAGDTRPFISLDTMFDIAYVDFTTSFADVSRVHKTLADLQKYDQAYSDLVLSFEAYQRHYNELLEQRARPRDRQAFINILADIDTNLESLKKLEVVVEFDNLVNIDENVKRYVMKYSQVATNLELYSTEGLEELISAVEHYDALGNQMNVLLGSDVLSPLEKQQLSETMVKLSGMAKTRNLYSNIMASEVLDSNAKYAMMDTLQSYATRDLATVLDDSELYKYLITKNIDDNISANTRTARYSLESQRIRYGDEFDGWMAENYPDITTTNHDAEFDVALTEFIAGKVNVDLEDAVIFDLETVGLNKSEANKIIQIAYKLPGGEMRKFNIAPDDKLVPEPSIMRKLLGADPDEAITDTELYSRFTTKFSENAVTEEQALMQFLTDINSLKAQGREISLVGHNIKGFDLGMLKNRLGVLDLPQITNVKKIDTYDELLAKDGVARLSPEQSTEVGKFLDRYLSDREYDLSYRMHIKNTTEGTFENKNLYTQRFIEDAGGRIAGSLKDTSEAIRKGLGDTTQEGVYSEFMEVAQRLGTVSNNLYNRLKGIGGFNRVQGTNYIDSTEMYKAFPGMVDATPEVLEEFLATNNINITRVLNEINVENGVLTGLQPVAAKTLYDTELIKNYYRGITGQHSPVDLEKLHRASKIMQRNSNRIMNLRLFSGDDIGELERAFKYLQSRIPKVYGDEYIPTELKHLVFNKDDLRMSYAQTLYLFNRMRKLINDDTVLKQAIPDEGVFEFLYHPKTLQEHASLNIWYDGYDKFESYFKMNHYANSTVVQDSMSYMYKQDPIKATEKLLSNMSDSNLITARAFADATSLQTVQRNFDTMVSHAAFLKETEDEVGLELLYQSFRNIDDRIAAVQLDKVLKLNPEQLRAYLWNDALGVVTMPKSELSQIIDDLDVYRLNGMEVHETADEVIFYLTDEFDEFDLVPNYKLTDTAFEGTDEWTDKFMESRKEILSKQPTAAGTNMEILDRGNYMDMRGLLPESVEKKLIKMDVIDTNSRFLGINFNHSILGSNHLRRKWLPHIYNNPYKNVYGTAQRMLTITDAQTKYTHMMFDPTVRLDSEMYSQFSDEDLLLSLKNDKALRLGSLVEDAKTGYKVHEIKVQGIESITEARRLGAVVLPSQFLNKASKVINDNKITNDTVQFFNKWIVGTTKTGQLTSLGFLLRNLFDSSLKNVMSAGNVDMMQHMMQTAKLYHEYTEVLQLKLTGIIDDITEYLPDVPGNGLDIKTYELFHDFINDGASAGLTKATQDELSNIYKALHRKSHYSDMLRWEQIRDFIEKPLERPQMNLSDRITQDLLRLEAEQGVYAKAHAMTQHTRKTGLNTDTIAEYLKRPERLPADLFDEFQRISKYDAATNTQKSIDRAVFENPLSGAVMSANNYLEQIFRLSNFTYSVVNKGLNIPTAMSEVLRVHFDTTNKTYKQMLLEMMFPFSTFAQRNVMFWADEVMNNPSYFRYARDIMAPSIDLSEYSPWDLENRMSLQYHILQGNFLLNDQTGLTVKLSPSMMDAYSFLYDPVNTIQGKLVPIIRNPLEAVFAEKEDWMDEEYFRKNKANSLLSTIPLIGPGLYRGIKAGAHVERTGSVLPKALSSVFGSVNLPKDFDYPKNTYQYQYYSNSNYNRTYGSFAMKPQAYNRARYTRHGDIAGMALMDRRINRHLKRDMFTASGKSRLANMMIPASPGSAKFTINNIWRKWSV